MPESMDAPRQSSWPRDHPLVVQTLALTPLVFRLLGPALGVYVLVSLLVPLSGGELEGIGCYTFVLFPLVMAVATIYSPRFRDVIASALFLALSSGLFVTAHRTY
tara:strand:+ start:668 stop:982 length:315 start_codon:yes stop_codon:yes gene_type:complete